MTGHNCAPNKVKSDWSTVWNAVHLNDTEANEIL